MKNKVTFLIIFTLLFYSCLRQNVEGKLGFTASSHEDANNVEISQLPVKVFIRNGILSYYGNKIGSTPFNNISELLSLYTEQELHSVTELYISKINLQEIDSLDRLPNLEDLTLGACKITSMKGLEMAPKLKGLNLSQNPIGKIEYLETLKDIEEIYIANSQLKKIEGIEGLQKLRELDLSGNQLTKIEGLSDLPSLERLSLSGNQIVDYSGLLEIKTIKEISITSLENIVDDNAVAVFTEWNKRFPAQALEW